MAFSKSEFKHSELLVKFLAVLLMFTMNSVWAFLKKSISVVLSWN